MSVSVCDNSKTNEQIEKDSNHILELELVLFYYDPIKIVCSETNFYPNFEHLHHLDITRY